MASGKYPDGIRSYAEYLVSQCWRVIRTRVMRRDQRKCQVCGKRARCVHHLNYKKPTLYGKQDQSLISLCFECHHAVEWDGEAKIHGDEWKRKYQILDRMMRKQRGITLREWQGRKPGRMRIKRKKPKDRRPKANRKELQAALKREHERIGSAAEASLLAWRAMPHWQKRNLLALEAG